MEEKVAICCNFCRRPIRECTASSCDDTGTYNGRYENGKWVEAGCHVAEKPLDPTLRAAELARRASLTREPGPNGYSGYEQYI